MTGHMAVETERLGRVFTTRGANGKATKHAALDDVTLSVRRGELFGLVGVNGSGKSTLLQILAAQLRPSSGCARVAGFDVCRYAGHVRRHTAAAGHDHALIGLLRHPEQSTGERQRAVIERVFAGEPKVVLLDQPTLALDCVAAREVRAAIRRWRAEDGTRTIVLATNDLREADELCDRVAILDAGRVVACDTPAALVEQWPRQPVELDERAAFGDLEAAFLRIVRRPELFA